MNFKTKKGFKTIKLSEKMYNFLNRLSFAKKQVPKGKYTDTHYHKFFSAYLVKNMEALRTDNGDINMPQYALVLVYPFVNHTWVNSNGSTDDCYVSDLSPAHGEHFTYSK